MVNHKKLSSLFLVLEFVDHDLKVIFGQRNSDGFSEDHVTIILYNLLCATNFVHTANVMHRDLKPANILIDDECLIKLCDFGMSRTYQEEKEME